MKSRARSAIFEIVGITSCAAAGALFISVSHGSQALSEACAGYNVERAIESNSSGDISIDPAKLEYPVLANYRQQHAASQDFLSDYALAATSMRMPPKIWWTLRKKPEKIAKSNKVVREAYECSKVLFNLEGREYFTHVEGAKAWAPLETEIAQIENLRVSEAVRQRVLDEYYSGKIGLEGELNPIRIPEMVKMFEQVLYEEWRDKGIEPKYGEPHRWTKEFLLKHGRRFSPIAGFSKLLIGLSRGVTDLYMVTEKENDLRRFILERPLRGSMEPLQGLTLDQLFRQSYLLNEGDVYKALLTIENILAVQWRDADRERLGNTLRFRPIINYFGNGADHYGSWYHLFGIMLYGYTKSLISAKFVAHTESIGSFILGEGEETQEDYINSKGATLGTRLRKVVKNRTYLKGPHDPGFLVPEYYLNLNEDFTERLLKLSRRLERKQ